MANKTRHPFHNKHLILWLLFAIMLTACQPAEQNQTTPGQLVVTVSILPQAYFVERIGGEAVSVNVMVGPGEEAHTYEPKPEQMKALSDSQVFFSIGVEYEESWIPRFADVQPEMLFVDSSAGIVRIPIDSSHSHEDDNEEEHSDEARLDPHVWLSPNNGKIIAQNILSTLVELAPEQEATFQENYDALMAEIDALDAHIQAILNGLEQRTFMVFHPAWGYFCEQYDLEQLPVQVGGQDPSASELAELVETAREKDIHVIFVQPTFSTMDAEAIAEEINGKVAVVDPLAQDWLANLTSAAETFAAALGDSQLP